MRKLLWCTLLLMGVCFYGYAQEPLKRMFDFNSVSKYATTQGAQALQDLVTTSTDCIVKNKEFIFIKFRPSAFIEVTSLKSDKKRQLSVPDYARALHVIRCQDDALYNSIQFDFELLPPSQDDFFPKGDTCWITVPVRQYFTGKGRPGKGSYGDITLKEIVMCCYYVDGVLKGEIDRIIATETIPYHKSHRFRA